MMSIRINASFALATATYAMATLVWWLQPALINEIMLRYGVRESQAGFVASIEMTVIAISSFITSWALNIFSKRALFIGGIIIIVLGSIFTIYSDDFQSMLITRIFAGLGEGALLAISSAIIAGSADPDRAYGRLSTIAIIICSAAVFSLPISSELAGLEYPVFPTIFLGCSALAIIATMLSRKSSCFEFSERSQSKINFRKSDIFFLGLDTLLIGITSGSMWPFYYPYGQKAGLSQTEIDAAVGLSTLLSIGGPMLAAVIGTSLGRFSMLSLGTIVLTCAIVGMTQLHDPVSYRVSAVLIIAATYFSLSYFLGYAALLDRSGRGAGLISGIFLWTGAAGPYVGGVILEHSNGTVMSVFSLCANVLALLLIRSVDRSVRSGNVALWHDRQGDAHQL